MPALQYGNSSGLLTKSSGRVEPWAPFCIEVQGENTERQFHLISSDLSSGNARVVIVLSKIEIEQQRRRTGPRQKKIASCGLRHRDL